MGIIQIFRSRKIVFIAIGLLIFLLYMWPSWLTLSPSTSQPEGESTACVINPLMLNVGPLESCVFSQLHKYDAQSRRMNTFIQHIPKRPDVDSKFVSYVGNGHMGTSIKSTLYVRNKTDISIPINYFHHIGIDVPGSYRQGWYMHLFRLVHNHLLQALLLLISRKAQCKNTTVSKCHWPVLRPL